ncbi:MAG: secretin and TonB N-terminal domain-containing protein [bacterium]
MKFYRLFKIPFLTFLVALFIYPCCKAWAQNYEIEEIELVNMGNSYRIFVQSSGAITYAHKLVDNPPTLQLYISNSTLNLKRNNLRYHNTLIKKITATQWKKSPAIVKIAIALAYPVEYEIIKKMDGLIYIDLMKESASSSSYDMNATRAVNPDSNEENAHVYLDESNSIPGSSLFKNPAPANSVETTKASKESNRTNNTTSESLPAPLSSKERISLEVKGAEITSVLRLLAKQTNLNIVAIRDTGKVTVNLVNVTIKEALDLVAKANGYDYVIAGNVILVKPREKFELGELQTKVYRLKYIDANNLKASASQVLSKQAKIQVFNQDFQPTEDTGQGQKKNKKKRSSTLIVTDTPANIRQLEVMIAALDVPTPQIMIEAKLLEISPQNEEKLGINWSKTINAEIFREVLLPSGQPYHYSAEIPVDGGSINFGTLKIGEYNAVLDFLNTHTNTKLVSNPRILAMDNQKAVIKVGTNFPIPQINRGVGGQGDIVTFQYRNVDISLQVTPHVAEDQTISLYVNPIIEEITGEVVAGENRAPITSKREVETVVNLKSNETMVIGGLIKESTIETINKVWLLGDIPLIGNLFRHKTKTKRQTDLLIFITPRLMKGS